MLADNNIRQNNNGVASIDQIQQYHEQVFDQVSGVSANAWTPDYFLRSFDTLVDRQTAWDNLVSSGAVASYNLIAFRRVEFVQDYLDGLSNPPVSFAIDVIDKSEQELIDIGFDPDFAAYVAGYQNFLNNLQLAGLDSVIFASSNEYGPYSVSILGAGQMIGGDQFNDTLNGTSSDDVLLGFNGADTFTDSAGADRIYGLGGSDLVDFSDSADRIFVELGPLQNDQDLWAPVIAQGNEVQRVLDASENYDVLIGIEALIGSDKDDVIRLFGTVQENRRFDVAFQRHRCGCKLGGW